MSCVCATVVVGMGVGLLVVPPNCAEAGGAAVIVRAALASIVIILACNDSLALTKLGNFRLLIAVRASREDLVRRDDIANPQRTCRLNVLRALRLAPGLAKAGYQNEVARNDPISAIQLPSAQSIARYDNPTKSRAYDSDVQPHSSPKTGIIKPDLLLAGAAQDTNWARVWNNRNQLGICKILHLQGPVRRLVVVRFSCMVWRDFF
jgi:hypothetical protein